MNNITPDRYIDYITYKMYVLFCYIYIFNYFKVKRGQIVNVLYRENDWVYVIVAESRREGFIPHSYCAPCEHHDLKKKLPRSRSPTDLAHRDVSQ